MDKIKFWTFDELADYNYGVKEFEIRFQHMIEDYLKANGISEPWYRYYHNSLFKKILDIYKENIEFKGNEILEDEERILLELHQLYDQVIEEVSRKVKNAKQEKEGFRKKWVEQELQKG